MFHPECFPLHRPTGTTYTMVTIVTAVTVVTMVTVSTTGLYLSGPNLYGTLNCFFLFKVRFTINSAECQCAQQQLQLMINIYFKHYLSCTASISWKVQILKVQKHVTNILKIKSWILS